MKNERLDIKDIIMTVLMAIINVIVCAIGGITGFLPILFVFCSCLYGLLLGYAYMAVCLKVKKRGAIFIYAIVQCVLGLSPHFIIGTLASAVIAEIIMEKSGRESKAGMIAGYVVMVVGSLCLAGTVYPFVITKQEMEKTLSGLGMNSEGILSLINVPVMSVLVIMCTICSLVGGIIGYNVMFKRLNGNVAEYDENEDDIEERIG